MPSDFDDEDCDGDFDDDEEYGDCGEDRTNGGCSLAGSEECDFECPYRDSMLAKLGRKHKEDAGQMRLKNRGNDNAR